MFLIVKWKETLKIVRVLKITSSNTDNVTDVTPNDERSFFHDKTDCIDQIKFSRCHAIKSMHYARFDVTVEIVSNSDATTSKVCPVRPCKNHYCKQITGQKYLKHQNKRSIKNEALPIWNLHNCIGQRAPDKTETNKIKWFHQQYAKLTKVANKSERDECQLRTWISFWICPRAPAL